MEVKFCVYETPKPKDRKGKPLSHARLLPRGTKHIDDICEFINEVSSLNSADIKGALEALFKYISFQLSHGYNVEMENFGHFSVALRTRQIMDSKGKSAFEVTIEGVNFRCSPRLKRRVMKSKLKRVKRNRPVYPDLQQRKERMISYLQNYGSINQSKYAEINGCTRYTAQKDFRIFLEENVILPSGKSTHKVYLLTVNP